jgi:hypothetical protein
MIQIGVHPLSAASQEGRPSNPDQAAGGHTRKESRARGDSSGQPQAGSLVVSPPPCPFPQVFPGL